MPGSTSRSKVNRSAGRVVVSRKDLQHLVTDARARTFDTVRDLSDEQIKPVLTLKHHEIAKFSKKHDVNVEWLLEGKGRIFEKDPITLNPNMSAAELAALVRTLPEAEQQMIEAAVDWLLKERGL